MNIFDNICREMVLLAWFEHATSPLPRVRSTAGAIAAHGALIHQETDICKQAICRIYVYGRLAVKYARQARRADLLICPMVLLFWETASGRSVWSSWHIMHIYHPVDRRRAAYRLAARTNLRPAIQGGLCNRPIAPVIKAHIYRIGKGCQHLNKGPCITAAIFNKSDRYVPILAQPLADSRTSRFRPDNDIIKFSRGRSGQFFKPMLHR